MDEKTRSKSSKKIENQITTKPTRDHIEGIYPQLVIMAEELSEYSKPELLQKIRDRILTSVTLIQLPNGTGKPFLIYLLELDPVSEVIVTLETIFEIDHLALSKLSSNHLEEILLVMNLKFFPVIMKIGLSNILETDPQILKKVAIRLLLMGNVSRILALNNEGLLTSEMLIKTIHTPGLIINVLNYLYQKVGELCRQYKLGGDAVLLGEISQLEKKYVTVFRFIRSNGIELSELCNISDCLQAVMNTYLYGLIKYFLEHTNDNDQVNVVFYHYSNFPISNKVVMSPIYNNTNYLRIQELLRERLFIKRIVKKKIGKKTIRFKNFDTLKLPEVSVETYEEEQLVPTTC